MSNRPISNWDTPDPWMIPSPIQSNLFYFTFTLGNRIEIWSSPDLENFFVDGTPQDHGQVRRSVIWQPSPNSPWSADVWAPELHWLFGTWYIYAAAAQPGGDPKQRNATHRTIVLRCTNPTRDPLDPASWSFEGPLLGLPNDQWSIDANVFSPDSGLPDEQRRWYVCYSGWPLGDFSDTAQDLFLARLKSPTEADPSSLTVISRPELPWERPENGRRGVNEGPTWLAVPASSGSPAWRGIVYSANGSWTSDYQLGILTFTGSQSDDLCNASLWHKRPQPLLASDVTKGPPFGPGHASFVPGPNNDGTMLCVYHGTEAKTDGWNNRKARVLGMNAQCFTDGCPSMCCAYSVAGPISDTHGVFPIHGQSSSNTQNLSQVPIQQQQPQVPLGQAQGQSQGTAHQQSSFDKFAGELEKKIPPQFQGAFAKAKGFFK